MWELREPDFLVKTTEIFGRLCATFPHSGSHKDIAEQMTKPDNATYAWYDVSSEELLAVVIWDASDPGRTRDQPQTIHYLDAGPW